MTRREEPDSVRVRLLPEPEASPTGATGPVSSVQEAELTMPPELLERIWRPKMLESLARGYWEYLRRRSRGLFRVLYGEGSRSVALLGRRRLVLLRFRAPSYETGEQFGRVTWPIESGLLVSRSGRGRGHLRIEADRQGPRLTVRAEVANFYPWLRGSGPFARLGTFVYSQTQVRLHVRITRGFLRSLEQLDLR
ncbi:MAG: hypothetical protein ACXWEF_00150 [Solirubrobacterales bacterium]